ncbi:MAG: copper amine oxidase N-terminal domain-containing protein [Candidatus Ornithomonoglobus sp.]
MKKIISLMLAGGMLLSAPTVMAADAEIAFKVGDSILQINGNPVEVETPYVVGEGTTLVPLRVISEAFGAAVSWNGDTKIVIITFSDHTIQLQIDNKTAIVNGEQTELEEAPQLTDNGFTMVPLRFICKTFGASISYDEKTQGIAVSLKEPEELKVEKIALTAEDAAILQGYEAQLRYCFEQEIYPQSFADTAEWDEGIAQYYARVRWGLLVRNNILYRMEQSDTEYNVDMSIPDFEFLYWDNFEIPEGLDYSDYIKECTFEETENGDKIEILSINELEFPDKANMTLNDIVYTQLCKYIAVVYNEETGYRIFTLEADALSDYYLLCEICNDGRGNYGILAETDYDNFISAVKAVLNKDNS